ncbi:MAG: glutathione S-transferase-like protein [Sphingomonadales bacterium]|nr:glutathione S-transferase-like protein [Sphingomonadales bacterium]
MTIYRLISFKACPWVQRAAIVLREKQIDFEFVHIETGNRPDWFAALSPHGKVPVLQIENGTALFESNAIVEYLDETTAPRLHPEDAVTRAINRAWAEYVPSFSAALGAFSAAQTDEDHASARKAISAVFARLEEALGKQASGPFFNGDRYSLVDAGFAPFLQRYLIVADLLDDSLIRDFPRLDQWATSLIGRPSTHSFPPAEFRLLYIENLKRRGGAILQRSLKLAEAA